jgi:hypothetical protein
MLVGRIGVGDGYGRGRPAWCTTDMPKPSLDGAAQ